MNKILFALFCFGTLIAQSASAPGVAALRDEADKEPPKPIRVDGNNGTVEAGNVTATAKEKTTEELPVVSIDGLLVNVKIETPAPIDKNGVEIKKKGKGDEKKVEPEMMSTSPDALGFHNLPF